MIPDGGAVTFTTPPDIGGTAFSFNAPGDTITINEPGLYHVDWAVDLESGSPASAFSLSQNGDIRSGTGNVAGGGNLAGSALIQVTTTPYTVSLINTSGDGGSRTLVAGVGSSANINIIKFADGPSV